MKIEHALTIGDPKSLVISDSIRATNEGRMTANDFLVALGLVQHREGLGLHLLYAKYKKDAAERAKAIKLLTNIAHQQAPKTIGKIAGRHTVRAIELITSLAIEDYCRTADTSGAKCRCKGRGNVYDLQATREQGRPIEKLCARCNGLGIKRLPAARAYRIVITLLPELTQQTWSRNWKPFYEQLIQHCYQEESAALSEYNSVIKSY